MIPLGVLCQKRIRPESLFFTFDGNLDNSGFLAGVTTAISGTVGSIAYIAGLSGAGAGQALDIAGTLLTFNNTSSLAVGNVSWEFGCFINPLYQQQPLLQKRTALTGALTGWYIYNYYGMIYVGVVNGGNTYGQAVSTLNNNAVNKLKVVYNSANSTTKFYINDALIVTHTGLALIGTSGDLFSYGGTGHSYIDDMYFKLT